MKIEEIEQCYGSYCVNEVFCMAKYWDNRMELIQELKRIKLPWDAECLEMLIKYNFLNATR